MSGRVKDPFQELVDEITLIRQDMGRLQRTSLGKDEAKALNGHVAQALAQMKAVAGQMSTAASEAPQAVRTAVRHDLLQVDRNASQAASRAAQEAVEGVRKHLDAERLRFAQAAGEARREAWRSLRRVLGVAGRHARHRSASGRAGSLWPRDRQVAPQRRADGALRLRQILVRRPGRYRWKRAHGMRILVRLRKRRELGQ